MPSSASCGRTARKGGEVDLNGIHLTVWLRRIVTRARFARGLFLWLCLTNVTQLVQLYLYEGLSLPLEGMALLLLEGLLRVGHSFARFCRASCGAVSQCSAGCSFLSMSSR